MQNAAIAIALLCLLAGTAAGQESSGVFVNGVELQPQTVSHLERAYATEIRPERYWYDARAGLWGLEGGPGIGRIAPGLALGGRLQPGASGGGTGVFVNGREIHPLELDWLRQRFGRVQRARYWLDANGMAGFEGGPAQFNLAGADNAPGYNRNTPGGALMSDGDCFGFLHPDGASVMGGNC